MVKKNIMSAHFTKASRYSVVFYCRANTTTTTTAVLINATAL